MSHPKTRFRCKFAIAISWQLVVYALVVGGIFGEIYALLRIPWNSTGFVNVIGTMVGLALLELPLIVLISVWIWRQRRRRAGKTMA